MNNRKITPAGGSKNEKGHDDARNENKPCQKGVKNAKRAHLKSEGEGEIARADTIIHFHPYQRKWLDDDSRFKIGMMARQTGKTFAACAEIVRDCLRAEAEGKKTRWVILSRGERQAREAMEEAIKPIIEAYSHIYKGLAPEYVEDVVAGWSALEVRFANGTRITALPANPDTARGFSANVLLDEFAFHKDSRKIWQALFPVISKPGLKLRIVSTPNGKGNKFYELMTAGEEWSRHHVDIAQAIADGLDRNAQELQKAAGDDDLWQQEYLLKWLDEASSWLSYDLISGCENSKAGLPEAYSTGPIYIGNDIAARNDLWVAAVLEDVQGVLWLRELRAEKRISFAEQDAIMDELVSKYNPVRIAADQTGMGEKPVEDMKRRYGALRVEGVTFTAGRKLDMATALKERFEDRTIRIPAGDVALRADLHSIKKTTGITGAPRLIDDGSGDGHADRFWAFALAASAAHRTAGPIEFQSIGPMRFGHGIDGYKLGGAHGYR